MKRTLITIIVAGIGLVTYSQPSTNLNATLLGIFNAMPAGIQQNTMDCWEAYQKACRRSPEFQGISTNNVYDETGTNVIGTVVTTNHVTMTFTEFFRQALNQEKIGRVVQSRNDALYSEMYFKVGKTVVDGWSP